MNIPYVPKPHYAWDPVKNVINQLKHGVSFELACNVFQDPHRIVFLDVSHSTNQEKRYACTGKVKDQICTARFVIRGDTIRIFSAGYWRKERKIYEKQNKKNISESTS